ncbi:O-antigen ligase family protein [Candidatus Sumerlaeota bacterium]
MPTCSSAPSQLLEFREPSSCWLRELIRAACLLLAAAALLWGIFFVAQPDSRRLLAAVFLGAFLVLGFFSWTRFVEILAFILPLFVILPSLLGYSQFALAELALLGGIAGIGFGAARRPRAIASSCPLTPPLLLFALVALISSAFFFLSNIELSNPITPYYLGHGMVRSIFFDQQGPVNFISATMNIVEAVIVFHLALARVQLPGGRDRLLKLLTCSGILVALFGAGQWAFGWGLADYWRKFEDMRRVNATWLDPNMCASYLLTALAIAFALWTTREQRQPGRLSAWGACGMLGCALTAGMIVLTFSQIAWLGLLVGVAWYVILIRCDLSAQVVWVYRQRKWLLGGAVGLIVIAGIVASLIDSADPRALAWLNDDSLLSRLLRGRLGIWRRCFLLFSLDPWLGIHSGRLFQSLAVFHTTGPAAGLPAWNPLHENAHNQFLQYFVELGVLGGGLFVVIMLLLLFRAAQSACQFSGRERRAQTALGAGMVALGVSFLTGHPLLMKEMMMQFTVLAALLYVPGPADQGIVRQRAFRRLDPYLPVCLVILLATCVSVARIPDRSSMPAGLGVYNFETDPETNEDYFWARPSVALSFRDQTGRVRFELAPYHIADQPLGVTLTIGDQTYHESLSTTQWHTLEYELPAELDGRWVLVRIHFDTYWRPCDVLPDSDDSRTISARIRNLAANLGRPPQ